LRERSLAARVQGGLERLYQLDRVVDVDAFLEVREDDGREELLLREDEAGALELSLRVPSLAEDDEDGGLRTDKVCQIIEGVSHFVYVTDRAAMNKQTTQLELELQAEVDKYVVLAASHRSFDARASRRLRRALYEDVRFTHGEGHEVGERYRVANSAAARFVAKLEGWFLERSKTPTLRECLREFFHEGLQAKLRMAQP
jgi:hypothetical protein